VVLDALEKGEREGGATQKALIDDLPLFAATPPPPPPAAPAASPVVDMLDGIHPDELTPRAALDMIYKLKEAAKS
jgi:DNA mismatch repair protein MutS